MDALPEFPLFPDPLAEGVIVESDQRCAICGRARGALYAASQYIDSREWDEAPICPWCIADGSAGALGIKFNDATIYPASPDTPQMTPADRELVETRTPGFVTWQDNRWLMCCGRACTYLGEADAGDLRGRFAAAVPSLLAEGGWPAQKPDRFLDAVRRGGSPAAYIFQCRACSAMLGYWDQD